MKLQIHYYDSDESNILKLKIKKTLLYFLNITNNTNIDDIFNDLKCYQYIIIDDNHYYLSDKMFDTDAFFYIPFYNFIDMIDLLKLCNNSTFIIKLKNFNEYNILKHNYFNIKNEDEYDMNDATTSIPYFSLLIINKDAHIIDSNYSNFIFKYNIIPADVFIRKIKLKHLT